MSTPLAPHKSDVAAHTPVAATSAPRIPSRTGWESVSAWFEPYFMATRERT